MKRLKGELKTEREGIKREIEKEREDTEGMLHHLAAGEDALEQLPALRDELSIQRRLVEEAAHHLSRRSEELEKVEKKESEMRGLVLKREQEVLLVEKG